MNQPAIATAPVRAAALLARLPDGPVSGAEIGVFSGLMSRELLSRPNLFLYMVDSWEGNGAAYIDKTDWHASLDDARQDHYMMCALFHTQGTKDRRKVVRQRSVDAAKAIEDGSLDFVFLDADHSELGCRADLDAWWPKVKRGGFIGGHDYEHPLFPGVKPVVDAFAVAHGLTLSLDKDTTWFTAKPPDVSTVCCVNAGNYLGRGKEYVEKLRNSVQRNLSLPHRFLCFDETNLPHPNLIGWFNKLALFKPGVFKDGERVLYIDLDTVITGHINDLAAYDDDFAMLAPFFTKVSPLFDGYQSGLMAWRAGTQAHIWQAYEAAGFPEVRGGDQAFINSLGVKPDTWQAMYPGRVVSYKAENGQLPEGASVVCFHGMPRPHQITSGCVPEHWR